MRGLTAAPQLRSGCRSQAGWGVGTRHLDLVGRLPPGAECSLSPRDPRPPWVQCRAEPWDPRPEPPLQGLRVLQTSGLCRHKRAGGNASPSFVRAPWVRGRRAALGGEVRGGGGSPRQELWPSCLLWAKNVSCQDVVPTPWWGGGLDTRALQFVLSTCEQQAGRTEMGSGWGPWPAVRCEVSSPGLQSPLPLESGHTEAVGPSLGWGLGPSSCSPGTRRLLATLGLPSSPSGPAGTSE